MSASGLVEGGREEPPHVAILLLYLGAYANQYEWMNVASPQQFWHCKTPKSKRILARINLIV
jgi:hypothetical protein